MALVALGNYIIDHHQTPNLCQSVKYISQIAYIMTDRLLRRFIFSKYYFKNGKLCNKYEKGMLYGIINEKQNELLSKHFLSRFPNFYNNGLNSKQSQLQSRFRVPNDFVSLFIDWKQYTPNIIGIILTTIMMRITIQLKS